MISASRPMKKAVAVFAVMAVSADARMTKQMSTIHADARLDHIELKDLVLKSAGRASKASKASDDLKIIRQPSGGAVTETSYSNWFEQLGGAFISVLIGILLIVFSIPCMWVNERRAARFESLIAVGEGECSTVGFDKVSGGNRGMLVHVAGASAEGKKPLQDDRFSEFKFDSKCLRISSTVEAFQWVEHEKTEKRKDNIGGGETTIKTYTYSKEWTSSKIDSTTFKQRGHENRLAKPSMTLGDRSKTCTTVYYGEAFQLPAEMVDQLSNFQDASNILGSYAGDFSQSGEYYYYPAQHGSPDIGDMRATFKYIPDGPVTAMGLQIEDPKLTRDTFIPYRLVGRGCCCCAVSDDKLKTLQIKEGQKTPDDLYADDKMTLGPFDLCCYCCLGVCNLVTYAFSGFAPPQIFHLFPGELNMAACWRNVKLQAGLQKWVLRGVAWLMMLIGLNMCFEPLFTVIDIIPFLGPLLSKFIAFAVFICALIVTLAIATLVISIAYLFYRPLLGMFYLVIAAAVVAVPVVIIQMTKA